MCFTLIFNDFWWRDICDIIRIEWDTQFLVWSICIDSQSTPFPGDFTHPWPHYVISPHSDCPNYFFPDFCRFVSLLSAHVYELQFLTLGRGVLGQFSNTLLTLPKHKRYIDQHYQHTYQLTRIVHHFHLFLPISYKAESGSRQNTGIGCAVHCNSPFTN